MLTLSALVRVFVARGAMDLRRSFDRLSAQVQEVLRQDPLSGHVFLFFNRRRNRVKLLVWERNGFVIWYKRLERHRFHWPRRSEETVLTLTSEQLNWLLDGYDVWRMKPHEVLHFSVFS